MRRRLREVEAPQDAPPPELVDYHRAEWIGRGCHPECAFWQARSEWTDEHGPDVWPSVVAEGPDVPWHDEWGLLGG